MNAVVFTKADEWLKELLCWKELLCEPFVYLSLTRETDGEGFQHTLWLNGAALVGASCWKLLEFKGRAIGCDDATWTKVTNAAIDSEHRISQTLRQKGIEVVHATPEKTLPRQ